VRDDVERIINFLKEYKRKHSEDFYYDIRDEFNEKKKDGRSSDVELSAMLIYMNRTGFNGLYRVNQRGEFNVPFGSYSNPTICNEDNLKAVSKVLKDTKILRADFKEGVKNAAKGDFVYFDPPYVPVSDTANFTEYNGGGFGEKDHRRLAQVFTDLDKKGTKVALSNSDTEFTRGLYRDFNIHVLKAKRSINCNGGDRGSINELLVTNF
jgi:DNA adenine methylase